MDVANPFVGARRFSGYQDDFEQSVHALKRVLAARKQAPIHDDLCTCLFFCGLPTTQTNGADTSRRIAGAARRACREPSAKVVHVCSVFSAICRDAAAATAAQTVQPTRRRPRSHQRNAGRGRGQASENLIVRPT